MEKRLLSAGGRGCSLDRHVLTCTVRLGIWASADGDPGAGLQTCPKGPGLHPRCVCVGFYLQGLVVLGDLQAAVRGTPKITSLGTEQLGEAVKRGQIPVSSAASPRRRAGADVQGRSWCLGHAGDTAWTRRQDSRLSEMSTRN